MYVKLRSVLCACFSAGTLAFVSMSASAASNSGQQFYFNRVLGSGANSAVYKVMSETEYAAATMSRARAATSAGGVALTELSAVTYLGKSWNVSLTRTAERSALARAAALGGPVLGALGAAWFAYEVAKGFGLLGTSAGWEYEEGVPSPVGGDVLYYEVCGRDRAALTKQGASEACNGYQGAPDVGTYSACTGFEENGNWWTTCNTTYRGGIYVSSNVQVFSAPLQQACPATKPDRGSDGLCRSVGLVDAQPITPDQAAPVWDGILSENVVDVIQFARSLEQNRVNYDTSDPESSGPAEVEGPVEEKTTNNPDGSSSTERNQITINNRYEGATINISTTNNSSVTNVSSTGQSTTTTTTSPGETAQSECAKNPTALGCAKMGDPPTDAPPGPTEEPMPSAPSVSFGSSAGCPSPLVVSLPWGGTVVLTWIALCDVLSQFFAPLVLALASYSAFMGFVRSFSV